MQNYFIIPCNFIERIDKGVPRLSTPIQDRIAFFFQSELDRSKQGLQDNSQLFRERKV